MPVPVSATLKKHLHMRGANRTRTVKHPLHLETSPHAWSKLFVPLCQVGIYRNISTCVEQTWSADRNSTPRRKHLHMRGANHVEHDDGVADLETSPHAWSKQPVPFGALTSRRNISTCVEQTPQNSYTAGIIKKHLHMRGANLRLQPHASLHGRNISTCVEQTEDKRPW